MTNNMPAPRVKGSYLPAAARGLAPCEACASESGCAQHGTGRRGKPQFITDAETQQKIDMAVSRERERCVKIVGRLFEGCGIDGNVRAALDEIVAANVSLRSMHGRLHRAARDGNAFATSDLRDFERLHPETIIGGDWDEDAARENEKYQCRCCNCGNLFIGHKRRVTCRACVKEIEAPKG